MAPTRAGRPAKVGAGHAHDAALQSKVRAARLARGLSQQELAQQIGLTRQAVIAIENGHYVPNTMVALRLAQVFTCRVEDLFELPDSPSEAPYMLWGSHESDDPRLAMARIRGRLVGHPLALTRLAFEGFQSADGLDLGRQGTSHARLLTTPEQLDHTVLLLGCDPSLFILGAHLSRHSPLLRLLSLPACSRAALEAVARGGAHVAGSHLRDSVSGEFNLAHAHRALAATGGIVVSYAAWEQGFMVPRGNPKKIRSAEDLARRNVTLVNREPGAGSRAMLDDLLGVAGVPVERVNGYDRVLHGHLAVAQAIASGGADVGIGLRAAAHAFGLDFVPITSVRFDLVVPGDHTSHPGVVAVLDTLQSARLRADLAALPGYDVSQTGKVLARIPATA